MFIRFNLLCRLLSVKGVMIFPFVFYKGQLTDDTKRHEQIHLRQCLGLGVILFYVWYLIEFLLLLPKYKSLAYYHISFEQDAYINEKNPQYKKYYGWVRYVLKKVRFTIVRK